MALYWIFVLLGFVPVSHQACSCLNDTLLELRFSGAVQTKILNAHNTLRSQIARGLYKSSNGTVFVTATNMLKLIWNATLTNQAAFYSVSCGSGGGAGLSVFAQPNGSPDTIGTAATTKWANEFKTYGPMGYVTSAKTREAVSMAWARTQSVGCAYSMCMNGTQSVTTMVCAYYPVGNAGKQLIYFQGPTCSKCPSGKACVAASGLCV
ncbi:unnamed protein product, partial [Mesorhabditis belari]|uniref:SCP domain-containing protein n=1 Tax=Mesorhabditis belari TaxID=2138241 RepID=A0AAF3J5C4_9BILA